MKNWFYDPKGNKYVIDIIRELISEEGMDNRYINCDNLDNYPYICEGNLNEFCMSKVKYEIEISFEELVSLIKKKNTIKLNDQYKATIEGSYVKVGCQSFHVSKILELAEMIKNQK